LESGKFGFVRENGTKFHGGIDIKSFLKNGNGTPSDSVHAFMDGQVVYRNTSPNASNYGCYIILAHPYFLTLYAHLASIDVEVGQSVRAGQKIGVLGKTSNATKIPNERAHLHFEIDFQLGDGDHFAHWYGANFTDKNLHGAFNGLNLVGIDPIAAVEKLIGGVKPIDLFVAEKEAMTLRIMGNYVPQFLEKYAPLVAKDVDLTRPVKGWIIEFTWFGLPKKWTPIYNSDSEQPRLKLLSYRKSLLRNAVLREVLREKNGSVSMGPRTIHTLKKMGFIVD
jgi:murein DD-endopeptidase MepM/ murein hydrolase activator NlpD